MNSLTRIAPHTGTVAFGTAPKYGQPQLLEMPTQRAGRDSNGDTTVYGNNSITRCLHRLEWDNCSRAILDDLLLFYQEVNGCKLDFIWSDHLGLDHVVRFPRSPINWKQTGPDRHHVSIGLEEIVKLALIDEAGNVLIDENGNVLTY